MISTDKPLRFEGRQYYGAQSIGFAPSGQFIANLLTTPTPEPCGKLFTSIPISPKEFREFNPSRASASLIHKYKLIIHDDYGKPHDITGSEELITGLRTELIEQGLLNPEEVWLTLKEMDAGYRELDVGDYIQVGDVFQRNAGRCTPVVTGEPTRFAFERVPETTTVREMRLVGLFYLPSYPMVLRPIQTKPTTV